MLKSVIPIPKGGYAADPPLGDGSVAAVLEGWWHNSGRLRSMEGRILESLVPHVLGVTDGEWGNHEIYHAPAALGGGSFLVARNGNYLWLGIRCATTVAAGSSGTTINVASAAAFPTNGYLLINDTHVVTYKGTTSTSFTTVAGTIPTIAAGDPVHWVDWRPLWGDTGTGGYSKRPANTTDGFQQVNDLMYFGGGGVPGRYDGFEYHTGLVSVSTTTLTCATANFTTAGVLPGDMIYFRYETFGQDPYPWQKSEWDMDDGRLITAVGTTTLTISEAPDTAFTNRGPGRTSTLAYQIVRCSQIGVPAGVTTTASLQAGGAVPVGTYRYYWRYKSARTGYTGAMSDVPDTAPELTTTAAFMTCTTGTGTNEIVWTCKVAGTAHTGRKVTLLIGADQSERMWFVAGGPYWPDVDEGDLVIMPITVGEVVQASETAASIVTWANAITNSSFYATAAGTGIGVVASDYGTFTGGVGNDTIRLVRSWSATAKPEPHISGVEIWHCPVSIVTVNGITTKTEGAYELRKELFYADASTNVAYWDDATDASTATVYTLDADYLYHARPAATDVGSLLRYHGDRLECADPVYGGSLRFSTQAYHEYWPISGALNYGGRYAIGPDSDPIVDMITEGGSFQTAGRVGHSLMIWTHTRRCRMSGTNWGTDPFTLDEAEPIGAACVSAQNIFGSVIWMAPDGPMRSAVGSNASTPIYPKLWDRGVRASMQSSTAEQSALLALWRATIVGEFYVLSNPQGLVLYCYHVPSDSYTVLPVPAAIKSMCVWDGALDAGQLTVASATDIYRLWLGAGKSSVAPRARKSLAVPNSGSAETYQAFNWTTPPVMPGQADFGQYAKVHQVTGRFRKAYAVQTVTLSIYVDGDLVTPAWTDAKTIAADTGLTGGHDLVSWHPNGIRGRQFNFKLSGTFSYPVDCEGLEFTYTLQEKAK